MKPEKITLVLLPGFNGTAGLFDPLLSVATDEYELLVISYPTHEVKSYEELTEYVLGKISLINGRFVLVGESFSGPIAIFISARNITNHIGTILVASFVSAPYFKLAKYLPWDWIYSFVKPLYRLRIKFSSNTSLLIAASVEMQKVKPQVLAARTRAALSVDARVELAQIKIPLVYFRARYDVVVPMWNLKKIIALKPDIKVVSFNTQHFLLQSAPHAAWQTISNLCKKFARYQGASNA